MVKEYPSKQAFVDLWSEETIQVVLGTAPTDITLPDIIIDDRTGGVRRAVLMVKFRNIADTSAAPNSLSGAQVINASKDGGSTLVTAINLPNGALATPASVREGGDVLIGDVDMKAALPPVGGTLTTIWSLATSVGNNLNLNDVQVGVRFYYN